MAALPASASAKFSKVSKMFSRTLLLLTLVTSHQTTTANDEDPLATYDIFYTAGIEAYNQQRWFECMSYMQKALGDYKEYTENIIDCRLQCNNDNVIAENAGTLVELSFLEGALKRSDCLRRCKEVKLKNRPESIDESVKEDFDSLRPYDYLQICAYKLEKYETAVSAAFTYYLANPDHDDMKNNIEYYNSLKEVKPSYFKNLEAKPFQSYFSAGVESYTEERYPETVEQVERAAREYYREAGRCSALCEGPYDHESFPDFYNAIADHWISVMKCKLDCDEKMATINGEYKENYLAEHYNYLQFSYYKAGDLENAVRCTETYLLFLPDDEVMQGNKNYYAKQEGISLDYFRPREEARRYLDTRRHLERMLKFVIRSYIFSPADIDSKGAADRNKDIKNNAGAKIHVDEAAYGHPVANTSTYGPRDRDFLRELDEYNRNRGITITLENESLSGTNRVAVDGLLSDTQCQSLMHLADAGATVGDGYQSGEGRTSPHTDYEEFAGITVNKAAELARNGKVTESEARLYLHASEAGRAFLEKYYNLQKPLYFQFTHLVCRTALEGLDQKARKDRSHPVHADNCIIQEDGSCLKQRPAYIWRDFTALIYLNDGFEGGDFFWAHRNMSVQQRVQPRCGRMVGFEGSDYHGVEALTKGKRCALAMWYTLDPHYQETSHGEASAILRTMQTVESSLEDKPEFKQMMDKDGFELVMTEHELNGPARFAADRLATDEQCEALIKLTNDGALVGDGYNHGKGRSSPHTDHEKFAGLTLNRAGEDGALIGEGYKKSSPHTDHEKYAGLGPNRAGQDGGLKGDGYKTSGGSPHTNHEMFEGLTILRAAQLASGGQVDNDSVRLYLDLSEYALEVVKSYFKIKQPLYFDYTHLVCRTALDATNKERTDLSHPIHSDNCVMQPDHSCIRVRPAYTQRDYSAILYLNDGFEGGEFFFTHTNFTIQSSLRPKCGRLVGFDAGNYHGVKAVLKGQRCAIAMWYTLDQRYKEAAHTIARNMVDQADKKKKKPAAVGPDERPSDEL